MRHCRRRVFCSERRTQRRTAGTLGHRVPSQVVEKNTDGICLPHFKKSLLLPISSQSPPVSWNILPFHYFEVEMRSLTLDEPSQLPAGPRYSAPRETLHLSRYPEHMPSWPSPPPYEWSCSAIGAHASVSVRLKWCLRPGKATTK